MMPLLSIGLTHYDDFNGAWQTLTGLLANHSSILSDCEFVIVDNNPGSRDGKALRNFVTRMMREWPSQAARYIAYADEVGVAPVRNKLFSEAKGEFVLGMDPHIVFQNNALKKLVDYLLVHRESQDLLTGPIIMDDGLTQYTCQNRQWTSANFGVWAGENYFEERPFEVEQQGFGTFCMRKEAWPGFHPNLRGFGCVEPVLCEKVRRAGGKVLCLQFLRWHHRFSHYMKKAPYPVSNYDKARNHLIAFQEVNWNTKPIFDHFKYYLRKDEWERLLVEFSHLDFEKAIQ